MPAEIIKFRKTGKDGQVEVQIWGDCIDNYGAMSVDDMLTFLQNLKLIAITPEELIQELREGKDQDIFIEKRKHRPLGLSQ